MKEIDKRITLLVLTLNEIIGVKAILPLIDKNLFKQIIVVDGGSTDGTTEWCMENNYEIHRQVKRGFRFAYFEVWKKIQGDYVVTISPDGNCDVSKLPEIISQLDSCDLVIGSRYAPGVSSEDDDLITTFGNWFFNASARVLFDSKCSDVMVIYRGFHVDLPRRLNLFDEKNYAFVERLYNTRISWEPLMTIRAIRAKLRICDIPAGEPPRIGGERKLQIIRWGLAYFTQFMIEKFKSIRASS